MSRDKGRREGVPAVEEEQERVMRQEDAEAVSTETRIRRGTFWGRGDLEMGKKSPRSGRGTGGERLQSECFRQSSLASRGYLTNVIESTNVLRTEPHRQHQGKVVLRGIPGNEGQREKGMGRLREDIPHRVDEARF